MLLKNKRTFYLLFLVIVLLSGCNGNKKSVMNNYYLLLMGESETWNLTGYEVVITPENFKAGNGTLKMKNENEYIADYFHFETHIVINGEDTIVHSGSSSGAGIDITEESTGTIEGKEYLNGSGSPIRLNDLSNIYMIVESENFRKNYKVKERIDLYNKSNKENTLLN